MKISDLCTWLWSVALGRRDKCMECEFGKIYVWYKVPYRLKFHSKSVCVWVIKKKEEEKIKFKLWSQFEVVHDRSSSQFCHEIDLRDSLAVDSPEPGRVAVRVGKNKWRGSGWIIVLAGGQVAVFNTQVAGKMLGRCVSGQGSNDDISATKNLSQVKDL